MISSKLAIILARRNIHYGWVVVGVTFLTMLVTAGAMGAPGVLIVPLEHEFGWANAQISHRVGYPPSAFRSVRPVRCGIDESLRAAPGYGLCGGADRWRSHRLAGDDAGVAARAVMGLVVGVGSGLTAIVLAATVATRWFTHRRGLVVGLLSASSATGQLVFLPLIAELTERFGWRVALVFVCALLALAAVIALALMRDRPSDVNLPPYGETAVAPAPAAGVGLVSLLSSPLTVLADAARTPLFWVLFATFFICGLSTNGLIQTHFITLCADYGLAAVTAASVLATMGVFDFVGTIGSGWLSDRFDNRWLLFWYYGLRGLSLLFLPFTDFSFYGLSLFAVFYGLDWIATVPPTVKLTADRFGRERAGMVFGWIFAGHQIGAATAAFGAGFSRTEFASYLPAFFVAGAMCLIAAGLVLTIAKPSSTGFGAAAPQPARG